MNIGDLKQARDWLNTMHTSWEWVDVAEVCKEAVEKQIPKKLIPETTNEKIRYKCLCGKTLMVEYKNSLIFGTKVKYCPECGQALDWGKIND